MQTIAVKYTIRAKLPVIMASGGIHRSTKMQNKGKVQNKTYGLRRPHFERVLSEMYPANGLQIAFHTADIVSAIPIADASYFSVST